MTSTDIGSLYGVTGVLTPCSSSQLAYNEHFCSVVKISFLHWSWATAYTQKYSCMGVTITNYGSTFYVGFGQVKNGWLYLKVWELLWENRSKVNQNTCRQKAFENVDFVINTTANFWLEIIHLYLCTLQCIIKLPLVLSTVWHVNILITIFNIQWNLPVRDI